MSRRDFLANVTVSALFVCACAYCMYWLVRLV